MSELKNTIEQLGAAVDQFKAHHNENLQALERRLDAFETKANRPGLGGGEPSTVHAKAEAKALRTFLRTGDDRELKGMSVGSDPAGGYTVTPFLAQAIRNIPREVSPLRALARVVTIDTGSYEEVLNVDMPAASWVGETESRPVTDAPTLKKINIPVREQYAQIELTQTLIDDSFVDILGWVSEKVSAKFAEAEAAAFISGTGVNQPRGLLTYTASSADDDARTWGEIQYVASGAAADFAASNPGDPLIDLTYKLKAPYRANASWLMARATAAKIRKFKDGQGNYLWQPSTSAGQPDSLCGFPVHLDENVPSVAANALAVVFGDFRSAYTIVDRIGFRTLLDPYSNKPFVRVYVYRRTGADLLDFNAVKALKIASS